MNILLISPPTTIEERYSARITKKAGYLPPIGLLQIAAVLEEKNHGVKVLDLAVSDNPLEEFKGLLRGFAPEIVCFSISSLNASKAFMLARIADEAKNPLIVFGGPHCMVFQQKILQEHGCIDVVVVGDGEYAMLEITEAARNKKSLRSIKGIYFRDNKGNIVKTPKRMLIKALDELPFPAYHLLDLNKYLPLPHHYKRLPAINVVTSRGCPWGKCTFCFESIHSGHFRRMSPKRAVDLVKMLTDAYGIKEISFWDDIFTMPQAWVHEFCELVKREKIDITWSCYAKVDTVNLELLKVMASAGCWNIFYGLESGNQDLLDRIKKGTTLEQARNAIKWSKQAGIETRGAFMLALPGENSEKANKTIDFARGLDLDYVQFSYTTPYFGTMLHKQCSNEGMLEHDFSKYSTFEPVYLPNGYESRKELEKIFKKAYKMTYLRPKYLYKKFIDIRSFDDVKRLYQGLKILFYFIK